MHHVEKKLSITLNMKIVFPLFYFSQKIIMTCMGSQDKANMTVTMVTSLTTLLLFLRASLLTPAPPVWGCSTFNPATFVVDYTGSRSNLVTLFQRVCNMTE